MTTNLNADGYQVVEYQIKCRSCDLHYIVFSDHTEDWADEHKGGFCPECGSRAEKVVWTIPVEGFIFERVPRMLRTEMIDGREVAVPPEMRFVSDEAGDHPFGIATSFSDHVHE